MNHNQFLLLGLYIDKSCAPHMRKCLEADVIYPFYVFFKEDFNLDMDSQLSKEFFMGEGQTPNLSCSAIVGRNGSGKSTIIELILRLLNNLSYKLGELFNQSHEFSFIKGLRVSLYYSIGQELYQLKQGGDSPNDLSLLKYQPYSSNWIEEPGWEYYPQQYLFYNIFLNYSIYAFNSHDLNEDQTYPPSKKGKWIDSCFHKNDGYLAPVTLNPLRTNGNIDVNIERELAKSRLISLMFILPDADIHTRSKQESNQSRYLTYITNKYAVAYLEMSLDEESVNSKFERILDLWKEREDYSQDLMTFVESAIIKAWNSIYNFSNNPPHNDVVYKTAIKYLTYKTLSVAYKYNAFDYFYTLSPIFFGYKDNSDWEDKISLLVNEIDKDRSHITFRLRQTLAFLKFKQYDMDDTQLRSFSSEELSKILKNVSAGDLEVWTPEEFAPPPIFKIEIKVNDRMRRESFDLSQLSSGELQLIYSVSTVLYHLRNIDSVPVDSQRRKKYQYINIILDEIELYFHPEYQRKFIKRLIESIKNFPLKTIESINVLLITHSPFILSDIPISNVLFLKDGRINKSMQENTFAANIHSLLQNDFFLEDGTIGEFAKDKVNELFGKLHRFKNSDNQSYLRTLRPQILLVSEPILRSQLLRMYNELYGEDQSRLWEVINQLSSEIRQLKNDRNRYK